MNPSLTVLSQAAPGVYTNVANQMGWIRANIKANGLMMAFNLIAIPVAFKVGRQVLAKPLINPVNRQIRALGVKGMKV